MNNFKWLYSKLKLILIGLSIVVALLGFVFIKMYYIDEKVSIIGKNFTISINQDEVVDYSQIDKTKSAKDGIGYEPWFNFWGYNGERQKLINYMKENNFVIKPGLYYINQADRFEKVIKILKFEPKK